MALTVSVGGGFLRLFRLEGSLRLSCGTVRLLGPEDSTGLITARRSHPYLPQ